MEIDESVLKILNNKDFIKRWYFNENKCGLGKELHIEFEPIRSLYKKIDDLLQEKTKIESDFQYHAREVDKIPRTDLVPLWIDRKKDGTFIDFYLFYLKLFKNDFRSFHALTSEFLSSWEQDEDGDYSYLSYSEKNEKLSKKFEEYRELAIYEIEKIQKELFEEIKTRTLSHFMDMEDKIKKIMISNSLDHGTDEDREQVEKEEQDSLSIHSSNRGPHHRCNRKRYEL